MKSSYSRFYGYVRLREITDCGLKQKWMKEHRNFVKMMDTIAFEIEKGSWGSDDKFNAKMVKEMLSENGLEIDFTAGELLKVWRGK